MEANPTSLERENGADSSFRDEIRDIQDRVKKGVHILQLTDKKYAKETDLRNRVLMNRLFTRTRKQVVDLKTRLRDIFVMGDLCDFVHVRICRDGVEKDPCHFHSGNDVNSSDSNEIHKIQKRIADGTHVMEVTEEKNRRKNDLRTKLHLQQVYTKVRKEVKELQIELLDILIMDNSYVFVLCQLCYEDMEACAYCSTGKNDGESSVEKQMRETELVIAEGKRILEQAEVRYAVETDPEICAVLEDLFVKARNEIEELTTKLKSLSLSKTI